MVGPLLSYENLTVVDSTISGNSAFSGGAIYQYGGALDISVSVIRDNHASFDFRNQKGGGTAARQEWSALRTWLRKTHGVTRGV